ncbi:MAG: BON domain-containing protein [Actinomycetota bacterium]|nr:BON domain-containing protein [Actinomycetota bacterium]
MGMLGLGAAIGAAVAYLFDPNSGRRRRNMLRDRSMAFVRRGARTTTRAGRGVAAEAYGVTQKVTHLREEPKDYDDQTLTRKVESEIFRDADAPKDRVDVNVENGVVVLHGQLDSAEMIEELVAKTRKVQGVVDVDNRLHVPGTPAPSTPAGAGGTTPEADEA